MILRRYIIRILNSSTGHISKSSTLPMYSISCMPSCIPHKSHIVLKAARSSSTTLIRDALLLIGIRSFLSSADQRRRRCIVYVGTTWYNMIQLGHKIVKQFAAKLSCYYRWWRQQTSTFATDVCVVATVFIIPTTKVLQQVKGWNKCLEALFTILVTELPSCHVTGWGERVLSWLRCSFTRCCLQKWNSRY